MSLKLRLCASAFLLISPMIGLTACSHNDAQTFSPLTYDYLTPIFFNVNNIAVQNFAANQKFSRDVTNLSPVLPAAALQNMANTRFQARGTTGHAIFTIKRASLQEHNRNGIYGEMDATFDVYDNNNTKVASVEASVNHTYNIDPSKGDSSSKSNLYDATQKLMQDMNVELEFQIRKHLQKWIVDATGTPIAGDIKTQDLGNPGAVAPAATNTPAPTATKSSTAATNDDLSAVFPGGMPDESLPTKTTKKVVTPTTNSKLPTGSLGTLPETATPSGY